MRNRGNISAPDFPQTIGQFEEKTVVIQKGSESLHVNYLSSVLKTEAKPIIIYVTICKVTICKESMRMDGLAVHPSDFTVTSSVGV